MVERSHAKLEAKSYERRPMKQEVKPYQRSHMKLEVKSYERRPVKQEVKSYHHLTYLTTDV